MEGPLQSTRMNSQDTSLGLHSRILIRRSGKEYCQQMKMATFSDSRLRPGLRLPPILKETTFTVANKKGSSTVTENLKWIIPIVLSTLAVLAQIYGTFSSAMQDKINAGIASSPFLKDKFDEIKGSVEKSEKEQKELRNKVQELEVKFASQRSPGFTLNRIKEVSSEPNTARVINELPSIIASLRSMRRTDDKLPIHEYREASTSLLRRYSQSTGEVKNKIFECMAALVSTKSFSDGRVDPLTDAEIRRLKKQRRIIDSGVADLSKSKDWTDFVFKDCQISFSKPRQTLHLTRVRFIAVDLDSIPRNLASENLVAALGKQESTNITRKVLTQPANLLGKVDACCIPPEKPEETTSNPLPSPPSPSPSPSPSVASKGVSQYRPRRYPSSR